jgi:hypothetical protein
VNDSVTTDRGRELACWSFPAIPEIQGLHDPLHIFAAQTRTNSNTYRKNSEIHYDLVTRFLGHLKQSLPSRRQDDEHTRIRYGTQNSRSSRELGRLASALVSSACGSRHPHKNTVVGHGAEKVEKRRLNRSILISTKSTSGTP